MALEERCIKYESDNLHVIGTHEQVFKTRTVDGLIWTWKFYLHNNQVHLAWKFEWDEHEMGGITGVITLSFFFIHEGYLPFNRPLTLFKPGEWTEVVGGHGLPYSNFYGSLLFKYSFQVHPMPSLIPNDSLETNFEASDLTDVALIVEGKKLHVSKVFLSIHSEYFRAMFHSAFKEQSMSEIAIEDVKYVDFTRLLSILHPEPYRPTDKSVETLLKLADRFLMPGVTNQIEQRLLIGSRLKPSTLLLLADKYSLKELLRKTLKKYRMLPQIKSIQSSQEYTFLSDAVKAVLLDRVLSLI